MQKEKSPLRAPSKFIPTLNLRDAEELCRQDYKRFGHENTISTTGVPNPLTKNTMPFRQYRKEMKRRRERHKKHGYSLALWDVVNHPYAKA